MNRRVGKWVTLAIVVIAIIVPQMVTNKYYMNILIMSGIWSIVALSLNLILGYTGQVNLAHGAFFGIGAYASALMMLRLNMNFWLALPLAAAVAGVFGFLIGLPALRTRGSYFAIGTLCFNIIVTLIVDRWEGLTDGARGLMGIPGAAPIPLPWGGEIAFKTMASQYYLVLFFLVLTIFGFSAGEGRLLNPTQVEIGPSDHVYVVDGARVVVFDNSGNFLHAMSGAFRPPVLLYANGVGVVIVDSASMYCLDTDERPVCSLPIQTATGMVRDQIQSIVFQQDSMFILTGQGVVALPDPPGMMQEK